MDDLFTPDPAELENTLRQELEAKWKAKTPEEVLQAKIDSDLYIKTLERQKDELRADYIKSQEEIQKGRTLNDLIDQLNAKAPALIPEKQEERKAPQPDLADIEKLIESKYEQKRISEIEARNFNEVQNKLRERFGQNSGSIVAEQASTLGLSKDEINSLAKKSPEAFFRMLGLNQTQGQDMFSPPPRSDVRNDSYAPKTVKRTWNYYQELKAKNPNDYWSPKTQLQMHKDSEQLGAAFEDGNFNS